MSALNTGTAYFHSKRSADVRGDHQQRGDESRSRRCSPSFAEGRPDRGRGEVLGARAWAVSEPSVELCALDLLTARGGSGLGRSIERLAAIFAFVNSPTARSG